MSGNVFLASYLHIIEQFTGLKAAAINISIIFSGFSGKKTLSSIRGKCWERKQSQTYQQQTQNKMKQHATKHNTLQVA